MGPYGVAGVLALVVLGLSSTVHARHHHIVKVFILAGEANVEGFASTPHLHMLASSSNTTTRYEHLWKNGHWSTRKDVFVMYDHYRKDTFMHGPLSINGHFGSSINTFGPEIAIGHALGDAYKEPVVIIKTGWKGRSLAVDFASSPSSTKAGYQWFRMIKAIETAATNMHVILDDPKYKHCRLHISGFVWWHGDSDVMDEKRRTAYAQNLESLINDMRFAMKRPRLPVAVVELGGEGSTAGPEEVAFRKSQRHVVEDRFAGDNHVRYVPTSQYTAWMDSTIPVTYPNGPDSASTIYYGNAETHLQIGESIAATLLAMDGRNTGWFSSNPADAAADGFLYRRQVNKVVRFLVIVVVGIAVFVIVQRLLDNDGTGDSHMLSKMSNRHEYEDIPMEIELESGSFNSENM